MYTSYDIEKVAAQHRRDAIEAARQRRLARQVRDGAPAEERPTARALRFPRPRWFGLAVAGR